MNTEKKTIEQFPAGTIAVMKFTGVDVPPTELIINVAHFVAFLKIVDMSEEPKTRYYVQLSDGTQYPILESEPTITLMYPQSAVQKLMNKIGA